MICSNWLKQYSFMITDTATKRSWFQVKNTLYVSKKTTQLLIDLLDHHSNSISDGKCNGFYISSTNLKASVISFF